MLSAADEPQRPSSSEVLERANVVVFFTRGMSLAKWNLAGILTRELALYRELSPHLGNLTFVTYGDGADLELAKRLPGLVVLPNRGTLPPNVYSILAPWLHRRILRRASVFKTNQINGAWCGVIAKRLFRKPLVVRCGFLWSDSPGGVSRSTIRRYLVGQIERLVLRAADRVIVASERDKRAVITRYGIDEDRVHRIPNYVDTTGFHQIKSTAKSAGLVTFVGRLVSQKNLLALIKAIEELPNVRLAVVGDGPLRSAAIELAAGLPVDFLGRVPHEELPKLLNRSQLFVLPSVWEGHPKALLEAMACGVPVVGTRVPGIEDVLIHKETGYLCGTSPVEIREAIATVLKDEPLRTRMALKARSYIESECSLQVVVERELAVLQSV